MTCTFCRDGAVAGHHLGQLACEKCLATFAEAPGTTTTRWRGICGKCKRALPWSGAVAATCRCHVVSATRAMPSLAKCIREWETDRRPLWQRALDERREVAA
jgi:hypothetical protein